MPTPADAGEGMPPAVSVDLCVLGLRARLFAGSQQLDGSRTHTGLKRWTPSTGPLGGISKVE